MAGRIDDLGDSQLFTDKVLRLAGTSAIIPVSPFHYDNFMGDTFALDSVAVNKDAGATDFAVPATAILGGAATAACGATDDQKAEVAGPLILNGTQKAWFEARVKLSAVTTVAINLGLTDARNEAATTIAVQATGTTPTLTTTASDAALFCFDTDTSGAALFYLGIGVQANTDATTVISPVVPVADTYNTLRIELNGTNATYFVDGNKVGTQANAVTAATLLCPYMAIQARAGAASRTITVDYWAFGQSA